MCVNSPNFLVFWGASHVLLLQVFGDYSASTRRGSGTFGDGIAGDCKKSLPKTHFQTHFPNRQDDCAAKLSPQNAIGTAPLST